MAQKHCRKFQSAEQGAQTLQTDDRQTTDGRTTTYSEHEHEFTFAKNRQYLVGDFDEQCENKDNEQVVNDADSSDDDVDDLDCTVTDVGNVLRQIIIRRRRRGDVVPEITRQRCVLHHW